MESPVIAMVLMALCILSGLVCFAGGLWLLIVAFRKSVLWGLGCLFLPIVPIVFIAKYWEESKKAFLLWLAGFIPAILFCIFMLIPAFVGATDRAKQTKIVFDYRQMSSLLLMHAIDEGRYPTRLSELVPKYAETLPRQDDAPGLVYISGIVESDPGDIIVIHSLALEDGSRIVALKDGAATVLAAEAFEAALDRTRQVLGERFQPVEE